MDQEIMDIKFPKYRRLPDRTVTPQECSLLAQPVTLQVHIEEDEMYVLRNKELALIMCLQDLKDFDKEFILNIEVLIIVYYQAEPDTLSEQSKELQQMLETVLSEKAKSPDYTFEEF